MCLFIGCLLVVLLGERLRQGGRAWGRGYIRQGESLGTRLRQGGEPGDEAKARGEPGDEAKARGESLGTRLRQEGRAWGRG